MAKELGVEARLAEVTDSMNRAIANNVSAKISPMLRKGATVAVLGLAYKPYSHVTEESQGVYIAQHLSKHGARVLAFDPMSKEMPMEELRSSIVVLDSLDECLRQAEAVLITTPDPVFKGLKAENFKNEWAEVLVFDFWRLLMDELQNKPGIRYIGVGTSEDDGRNTERLKNLWWERSAESLTTGK
jgi:UDPglucose 6-dehydrogenase